jgi:hypothetical protein
MATRHSRVFWERLQDEPARAFQAFALYRDMGLSRSLRKAAQLFYEQDSAGQGRQKDGEGTAAKRRFEGWSSRWTWVARAESFDAAEARQRSLLFAERRIAAQEQQYVAARVALNVVLRKCADWQSPDGILAMPDSIVPSLLREATRTMQLALGEPTRIETEGSARHDPDMPTRDVVGLLSVEDQEELMLLAEKMDELEQAEGSDEDTPSR